MFYVFKMHSLPFPHVSLPLPLPPILPHPPLLNKPINLAIVSQTERAQHHKTHNAVSEHAAFMRQFRQRLLVVSCDTH